MNLELKNKIVNFILDNKELENINTHINNDDTSNIIVEFDFKTNYFSSYKEYSNSIDNCISNICLHFQTLIIDIKSDNIYKNNLIGKEYERKVKFIIREIIC